MPCFSNAYVSALVLAAKYLSDLSLTYTNVKNMFLSTLLNLTTYNGVGYSSMIHRRTDSVRYTAPVKDIIHAHGLSCVLYTDDTQLYISMKSSQRSVTIERIEQCISDIKAWMT